MKLLDKKKIEKYLKSISFMEAYRFYSKVYYPITEEVVLLNSVLKELLDSKENLEIVKGIYNNLNEIFIRNFFSDSMIASFEDYEFSERVSAPELLIASVIYMFKLGLDLRKEIIKEVLDYNYIFGDYLLELLNILDENPNEKIVVDVNTFFNYYLIFNMLNKNWNYEKLKEKTRLFFKVAELKEDQKVNFYSLGEKPFFINILNLLTEPEFKENFKNLKSCGEKLYFLNTLLKLKEEDKERFNNFLNKVPISISEILNKYEEFVEIYGRAEYLLPESLVESLVDWKFVHLRRIKGPKVEDSLKKSKRILIKKNEGISLKFVEAFLKIHILQYLFGYDSDDSITDDTMTLYFILKGRRIAPKDKSYSKYMKFIVQYLLYNPDWILNDVLIEMLREHVRINPFDRSFLLEEIEDCYLEVLTRKIPEMFTDTQLLEYRLKK